MFVCLTFSLIIYFSKEKFATGDDDRGHTIVKQALRRCESDKYFETLYSLFTGNVSWNDES